MTVMTVMNHLMYQLENEEKFLMKTKVVVLVKGSLSMVLWLQLVKILMSYKQKILENHECNYIQKI